ncbi:MAG: hypothetical protein OEX83_05460 [Gammaproteobacteria bacterium]|nr:hypothetical protein [Gammaproteobacteria bacterium]
MKEANTRFMTGLSNFLPGIKDSAHSVPDHHFHAATGRMDKLREIIDKNPNKVNEADSRGQVTLIWPIFTAQIEAVQYCLSMGADPFLKPVANSASPLEAAETMRNVSDAHNECYELIQKAAQAILKIRATDQLQSLSSSQYPVPNSSH